MTYNLTQLQSSTNIYDVIVFANDATTGLLISLFVVAIFIMLIMVLKRTNEFDAALLASSFICFLLTAFLRYANLINLTWVIVFFVATVLSGLYLYTIKQY